MSRQNPLANALDLPDDFDLGEEIVKQSNQVANVEHKEVVTTEEKETRTDYDDDYEYARKNLREIIDKAQNSLSNLFSIMNESESARAVETTATYVKTLGDLNKQLLEISKEKAEVKKTKEDTPESKIGHQSNYVFMGSSSELFTKMSKRHVIDVDPEE